MSKRKSIDQAELCRPILNERDYFEAKHLLAKALHTQRQHDATARIKSLMQAIANYERRFVDGDGQDADWVEDAYDAGLQDWDGPTQRWSDSLEA